MAAAIREIEIGFLNKSDAVDLERRAGTGVVRHKEVPVPEGSRGEPVMLMVVLAGFALNAYIAHLKYKEAIEPDESFDHTITITREDGTTQTETIRYTKRSGEAFSDEAVRQLTTVPGVPEVLGQLSSP
jgi:hypothetical protein